MRAWCDFAWALMATDGELTKLWSDAYGLLSPFIIRRIESVQVQLVGESNGETIGNNVWFSGKRDKKNSSGRNGKCDDAGSSKGSVQAEAKGWIDWAENASDEERRAALDSDKFRNLSPEVQDVIEKSIQK